MSIVAVVVRGTEHAAGVPVASAASTGADLRADGADVGRHSPAPSKKTASKPSMATIGSMYSSMSASSAASGVTRGGGSVRRPLTVLDRRRIEPYE